MSSNITLINLEDFDEKLKTFFMFIGLKILLFFNLLKTHFDIKYKLLYETNESFHMAIDTLDNGLYSFKKISVPYYIEPPYSYFKVCYKNGGYKEEYLNSDSLLYKTKTKDILISLVNTYKDFFNIVKPLIKNNELDYLALIHYKNTSDDMIISRVINEKIDEDTENNNNNNNVETTRNFFLSIDYTHPKMEKVIPITIDNKFLVSGNELFSSCFILRCLNYQSEPYIFDANYKLNILDSNIKNVVLNSDQYIRLSNNKYEIVTLHSNSCNKKNK